MVGRLWPILPVCLVLGVCALGYWTRSNDRAAQTGAPKRNLRVDVQRAVDPGASNIALRPIRGTVADLLGAPRPTSLSGRTRWEARVYSLQAHIEEITLREDGDLYLVFSDKTGTTVAELPDPAKCLGNPFREEIARTRAELETKFHPTPTPRKVAVDATVTGVAFFGQPSHHSNGARLQPLLSVDWTVTPRKQ